MTNRQMPIISHIKELRKKLLVYICFFAVLFGIFYTYSDILYNILLQPLKDSLSSSNTSNRLIFTSLSEGFTSKLKISFFTAFLVSIPFLLYQIWSFISPALYKNEKRIILPTMISSVFLLCIGVIVSYKFIMPFIWDFFTSFQSVDNSLPMNIVLEAKISQYFSFSTKIISSFALVFQTPVILFTLIRLNIISVESLKKSRKGVFLSAFIVSAIITPPDIISQIILGLIIYFLYEISILSGKIKR